MTKKSQGRLRRDALKKAGKSATTMVQNTAPTSVVSPVGTLVADINRSINPTMVLGDIHDLAKHLYADNKLSNEFVSNVPDPNLSEEVMLASLNDEYPDPVEDGVYNAAFFANLREKIASQPPSDPFESVAADKTVYPKGSLLSVICRDVDAIGLYADGMGGFYEEVIDKNSSQCGYKEQTQPQASACL